MTGQGKARFACRGGRTFLLFAQDDAAVHFGHQAVQDEALVVQHLRMTGDGHLTAAVQTGQETALGFHADAGGAVFHAGQQFQHFTVITTAFDAQGTLAHGGHEGGRLEMVHAVRGKTQTLEPGGGQHDGVVFAFLHLAQAGIHIAAQGKDLQVGTQIEQLGLTAQAAGAHAGPLGQFVQRGVAVGEQAVHADLTLGHAAQDEALGQDHGHVLDAVHGQVGGTVQQGFLDLLDEQALAAHLGHGDIQDDVAAGLDDAQADVQARFQGLQAGFDVFGLPEGQLTAAGGDDEIFAHGVS